MKYLKVFAGFVHQKDEIGKRDLLDVRDHSCDSLIDVAAQTYFDATSNTWKSIPKI